MKISAFILLSLFGVSAFADCDGRSAEAQFIGEIVEILPTAQAGKCNLRFGNFSSYIESSVCGLNVAEAGLLEFSADSCSTKIGTPASGILSLSPNGKAIWE